MRWSESTNNTGLVQDITFLTGLDTNAVSAKERARCANRWYYKAAILAWKSDPDWQFDDVNQAASATDGNWTFDAFAGLPRATRTLTDDVRIYALPTSALSVERVEILRANSDWYPLEPIEEAKIPRYSNSEGFRVFAIPEFYKTKGLPKYFNLVGSNIELFPAPATGEVTMTAGIKLYVSREIKEFVSTDTTMEPGIPEPFHRILSLGASYDIAIAKGLANARTLKAEVEQLLFEMQDYYTKRQRYNKKSIRPSRSSGI